MSIHEKHQDLPEFVAGLKNLVEKGEAEKARRILASYESGLGDPQLYDLLRLLYSYPLVQMGDHTFSCVVWECNDRQSEVENIDSILVPQFPSERPEGDWVELKEFEDFLVALVNSEASSDEGKAQDLPKFALRSLSVKHDGLTIQTYETSYFPVLRTSEYLKLELLKSWQENRSAFIKAVERKSVDKCLEYLPYRARLHKHGRDLVVDGSFRAAGVTVGTLLCYRSPGEEFFRYLLMRRARRAVMGSRGAFAVLPGGEFEPSFAYPDHRYSVKHNVLREFAEELFGLPVFGLYLQNEPTAHLIELMDQGMASLHFTGVTVDLLMLRPSICTLLLIRDPSWWKYFEDNERLNFEVAKEAGAVLLGSLERPETAVSGFPLRPNEVAAQGAGIVYLGLKKVLRLEADKRLAGEVSKRLIEGRSLTGMSSRVGADELYVVWYDPKESDPEKRKGNSYMKQKDCAERFEQRKTYFDMYADERAESILVRSRNRSTKSQKEVSWRDGLREHRHRRLLGAILEALHTNNPSLSAKTIEGYLGGQDPTFVKEWYNIRNDRNDLNRILFGLVNDMTSSSREVGDPDSGHFWLLRNISYCWIRARFSESLLLPFRPEQ